MARLTSPLRYPGGKLSLLDLVVSTLRSNDLELGHYAEPFAGGAGLALALLYEGHVAEIHINDLDRSIWAFWHCVLTKCDAFIDKMARTPVTIAEWHRQRAIYRSPKRVAPLDLGFSAFFLNRTNRSGVIKGGGVIGGLNQDGNYKLDCRFNLEDLERRIRRIHRYRDQIHLTNLDAIDFLKNSRRFPSRTLLFIDPPYYEQGSSLYANYYKAEDHAVLARKVLSLCRPWIVTYDNADEIRGLYRDRRQFSFDINYSLQEKRMGKEILVASKGLRMPVETRTCQLKRPQYRAAA